MRESMSLVDALQVLHEVRGDSVLVTSMAAAREWAMRFPPHPLDLIHVPSSMGQAPTWGLGLALAQPKRRVIVCCGDGSLLMNLGCLVTITAAAPPNLTLLVFDNGAYEVTGGQPTPAALTRSGSIDFCGMARSAGFTTVHESSTAGEWRESAGGVLSARGPACVVLRVAADPQGGPVGPLPPAPQRARELAAALAANAS
jgi:thiamine pyrophosphate-dependent acetolactate synthase large subunit-like protein